MSQFKVGDWVVLKRNGCVLQWTKEDDLVPSRKEEVYLWTPSIGEWVWKDTEFVKITHIANHNREDGLLTYSCSVPCRAESFSSSFIPEPFIGTLPIGAR